MATFPQSVRYRIGPPVIQTPTPPPSPITQSALRLVLGSRVLDLRDVNTGFVVTSFDPGFATVREAATDWPEQDGQFDMTRFLTARVAVMQGSAAPTQGMSLRDVLDQLGPFLDPAARPQIVYRLAPLEPLRVLNARIMSGSTPIQSNLSQFQLQFKVPDGVAYGLEDESGDLPATSSSPGFSLPVTLPLSFGSTDSDAVPHFLNVSGTYKTWPVFRIYGPCTQPIITWIDPVGGGTLGPKIALQSSVTISAGDFVEIDTRLKTVLMNGDPSGNRYSWLDLSTTVWGPLQAGPNLLHFQASNPSARCTATWTPTYL